MLPQFELFSFVFRRIEDTRKTFRNNWPLVISYYSLVCTFHEFILSGNKRDFHQLLRPSKLDFFSCILLTLWPLKVFFNYQGKSVALALHFLKFLCTWYLKKTLVILYRNLNLNFVSERVWTCWTHPQFYMQLVTFWNMNSSVLWAVSKKYQLEFFFWECFFKLLNGNFF